MKVTNLLLAMSLVLAIGLLLVPIAFAQEDIAPTVTLTPTSLKIAGVEGTVVTRTVLLQVTEGTVENLDFIALDLNSSDGKQVLPASAIMAQVESTTIGEGDSLTVPISVDLGGVASGAYSGDVLFQYDGGSQTLAMTVDVKDPWPLPLIVLGVGVAISFSFSYYRSQGQPRDEIAARLGRLTQLMAEDAELNDVTIGWPFGRRIRDSLLDVENAVEKEDWPAAKDAATQAEDMWEKWFRRREDWIELMRVYLKQVDDLQEWSDEVPQSQHLAELKKLAREVVAKAPSYENGPKDLEAELEKITGYMKLYYRLDTKKEELWTLYDDRKAALTPEQQTEWVDKLNEFGLRLNRLLPTDTSELEKLAADLGSTRTDLRKITPREDIKDDRGGRGDTPEGRLPISEYLANIGDTSLIQEGQKAERHLEILKWASFGLAILLLAGTGFGELYVKPTTFGATPWTDYFALLIWGFGAEATRSAVAEMVKGWGLAWVK